MVAFLDPIAGVVNLIVEYMDGGSLQDVVDGGGCIDEEVLADLAYQVLTPFHLLIIDYSFSLPYDRS